MPISFCSDCGQPSIGLFDLRARKTPPAMHLKELSEDPNYRSDIDRPLCERCSLNRGFTAPPTPPAAAPSATGSPTPSGATGTPSGSTPPAPPMTKAGA